MISEREIEMEAEGEFRESGLDERFKEEYIKNFKKGFKIGCTNAIKAGVKNKLLSIEDGARYLEISVDELEALLVESDTEADQ